MSYSKKKIVKKIKELDAIQNLSERTEELNIIQSEIWAIQKNLKKSLKRCEVILEKIKNLKEELDV